MPDPRPEVLDFLLSRRSRPSKTLAGPVPSRAGLMPILTAAARSPDHGKLEPWRFVVLEKPALHRLAGLVRTRGAALGKTPEAIDKAAKHYEHGGLAVVVIASPKPSDKVPEIEQFYSAGAVCLALLNAALASGWGANWLSGWASHDRIFVAEGLGLAPHEKVAGIIHIGTETAPPPERPRPDLDAITQWVAE
ncbi:MAG: nitroreductase [Rhodobacteraceae bacterium]|nr:nitroreductase [Paracoccaceae bacterium]